jgi:hypothetical protein
VGYGYAWDGGITRVQEKMLGSDGCICDDGFIDIKIYETCQTLLFALNICSLCYANDTQ